MDILALLTPAERALWLSEAETRYVPALGPVWDSDKEQDALYLLREGRVKLLLRGLPGIYQSRSHIMRLFSPGEPIWCPDSSLYSAVALEQSCLLRIRAGVVEHTLLQNSELCLALLRGQARELQRARQRLVSLTQKHLRARLAETLLSLVGRVGTDSDGWIPLLLSREELGNLSNMITANCIRTLSAFQREGLVQVQGRKLRLLQPIALKRISYGG